MKVFVKVALVIILVSAIILLARAEYQHFEREALKQKLMDISLTHPEVIAYRQEYPQIFQRELGITGSKSHWLIIFSEGTMPG